MPNAKYVGCCAESEHVNQHILVDATPFTGLVATAHSWSLSCQGSSWLQYSCLEDYLQFRHALHKVRTKEVPFALSVLLCLCNVEAVNSQVMIHYSLTFTQRGAVDSSCLLVGKKVCSKSTHHLLYHWKIHSFLFEMLPEVWSIRR